MRMIDLTNKSDKQLRQLLEAIKTSDADIDVKVANMKAIEDKLYGKSYVQALKDIRDAEPDYNDVLGD